MFTFTIVYTIYNVCHFILSSGMSFLDFMIWHPQYFHQVKIYLSTLPCTCSFPLCLLHRHKLVKLVLAVSSSLFILLLHNFSSLVWFLFSTFVIFCFINIFSAYLSNIPFWAFSTLSESCCFQTYNVLCLPCWLGSSRLGLDRLSY